MPREDFWLVGELSLQDGYRNVWVVRVQPALSASEWVNTTL